MESWGTPQVTGRQPDITPDDIGQLSEHLGMNPIWTYRLLWIEVEQQILHMFRVGWEFIIPTVIVLQIRAPRVPKHIIDVEDRGKEVFKHLCFAYVLFCEVTIPIK